MANKKSLALTKEQYENLIGSMRKEVMLLGQMIGLRQHLS